MRTPTNQDGITLLVTLLLMGVLLGISTSLLTITLKQFQLSSIAYDSEKAFQVASAGMECALYNDFVNGEFELGTGNSISCFNDTSPDEVNGTGATESGEEQRFTFTLQNADSGSNPELCAKVSIYKFYEDPSADGNTDGIPVVVNGVSMRSTDCPEGSVCTVIQSRGYNVPCTQINSGIRVVEREYTQVY